MPAVELRGFFPNWKRLLTVGRRGGVCVNLQRSFADSETSGQLIFRGDVWSRIEKKEISNDSERGLQWTCSRLISYFAHSQFGFWPQRSIWSTQLMLLREMPAKLAATLQFPLLWLVFWNGAFVFSMVLMCECFVYLQQFGPILDVEIIFNERGSKVRILTFVPSWICRPLTSEENEFSKIATVLTCAT